METTARRTAIALAALAVLLSPACGQAGGQAGADESATTQAAARGEAIAAQRSTKASVSGTRGQDPSATAGRDGDTVAPPTTSTTVTADADGSAAADGSADADAVCGEPPAEIAPVRGRPADAPPECIELGTGDVQVTLRWDSAADVDLHVTEPDGTEIWYQNAGPSATGGRLDIDSNVACRREAALENVFWPEGGAPAGTYTIDIVGYQVDGCGSGDYTVTAKVRGEAVLTESGTVGQNEVDSYQIAV